MAAPPFRFRLERVLEMRVKTEDEAREALGAALRRREELAGMLAAASAQLARAREAQAGGSASGLRVDQLLAHQAFVERAEREEQAAELELSRHAAEVTARRTALRHASRERQVLEKLRAKQEAEHRREAERLEAARVDELALAMHHRRSAA